MDEKEKRNNFWHGTIIILLAALTGYVILSSIVNSSAKYQEQALQKTAQILEEKVVVEPKILEDISEFVLFSNIIANGPAGYIMTDPELNIIYASKSSYNYVIAPPEDILKTNLSDIIQDKTFNPGIKDFQVSYPLQDGFFVEGFLKNNTTDVDWFKYKKDDKVYYVFELEHLED